MLPLEYSLPIRIYLKQILCTFQTNICPGVEQIFDFAFFIISIQIFCIVMDITIQGTEEGGIRLERGTLNYRTGTTYIKIRPPLSAVMMIIWCNSGLSRWENKTDQHFTKSQSDGDGGLSRDVRQESSVLTSSAKKWISRSRRSKQKVDLRIRSGSQACRGIRVSWRRLKENG